MQKIFLLFSIILSLVGVEVLLQLFAFSPHIGSYQLTHELRETNFFSYTQGSHYTMYPDAKHQFWWNASFETNEQGYLGESVSDVVVIGDSVSFGFGVKQDQSFGYLLSKMTNRSVAIAAVPGYSAINEKKVFDEVIKENPSLIIWQFGENDVIHPQKAKKSDKLFFYRRSPTHVLFSTNWYKWVIDRSELFYRVNNVVIKIFPSPQTHPDEFEVMINTLKEVKHKADEKNINVVFIYVPYDTKVYDLSEDQRAEVLSVFEDSLAVSNLNESDWFDDLHPNAKGHKKIAEELAHYLQ